jgi:hypothetical protein
MTKTKRLTTRMVKAKRFPNLNQSSVIILLNSNKLLRKYNHMQRTSILQIRSKSSQNLMISPILMVSISLDQFVIKVPVDLATLSLLLKLLNQDLI